MTSNSKIKCKKCRSVVVEECGECMLTSHSNKMFVFDCDNDIKCGVEDTIWYLNEENAPAWIVDRVKEENWLKGRLNCPHCGARIGSFDFTSGMKCECSQCILPGIHIIKNKVDFK